MNVLLTGATGFIGAEVLGRLLAAGHAVRALKRPGRPASIARVEWYVGDLTDEESLRHAVRGVDAVVHTAAEIAYHRGGAAAQRRVNVDGTRALVRAAAEAGARRFVHTSSVLALGHPLRRGEVATETQRYNWPPGLPYHESKRDAETAALEAARGSALEVVVLEPAMVFGPGEEPRGRTLAMLRNIRRGMPGVVPPGGITLCDVRDVAAALVTALAQGRAGERYILGGATVRYAELYDLFARELLVSPRPARVVSARALQIVGIAVGLIDRWLPLPVSPSLLVQLETEAFYSSEKAMAELAYAPRPATETARDTVAWYRARDLV